ncbi:MAG: hypothetical protein JO287_01910 [Pseudonocardiales bacterium]|nr:hypothetical protein [Pseudonocardiales bacterium]
MSGAPVPSRIASASYSAHCPVTPSPAPVFGPHQVDDLAGTAVLGRRRRIGVLLTP